MPLSNKIVFITGASSGIGKACAMAFAQQGAKLILAARRMERLQELAKELNVPCHLIALDVRDKHAVQQQLHALPQEWRAIDVLVNNAGLARGLSSIQEGNLEDWEEMIDTNVKGLLYITREIAPMMAERNIGHIVNLGSIAGREVYANGNVYCATKFAVGALSQAMRIDLLKHNIKVTNIVPGVVETEFSQVRFHGDETKAEKVYQGFEPLKAEDIANAILYVVNTPAHVNIAEIVMMPTAQASTTVFNRT
jgi:NADP-dependent 3-hydroxy acid dehydrogenase YdfG